MLYIIVCTYLREKERKKESWIGSDDNRTGEAIWVLRDSWLSSTRPSTTWWTLHFDHTPFWAYIHTPSLPFTIYSSSSSSSSYNVMMCNNAWLWWINPIDRRLELRFVFGPDGAKPSLGINSDHTLWANNYIVTYTMYFFELNMDII